MTNQDCFTTAQKNLRQKAEELVKRKDPRSIIKIDDLKLIHELQVHQIELEMQNEELLRSKEKAELASEKYINLFDFAPAGFIILSNEGDIIDLNFSAARLLGKDRMQLKNTRLGLYIHPDSQESYHSSLNNIFIANSKEACELFLIRNNEAGVYVHIDAVVSEDKNQCLLTLVDISERKRLENELQATTEQLKKLNDYFLDRELRMVNLKKEINELLVRSGCEEEYLIQNE